jgi:hypothetical protein
MEVVITFESGPVRAEIRTEPGENYLAVLDELSAFVEAYEPPAGAGADQRSGVTGDGSELSSTSSETQGDGQVAEGRAGGHDDGGAAVDSGGGDAAEQDDQEPPAPQVDPVDLAVDDDAELFEETGLTREQLAMIATPATTTDEDEVLDPPTIIAPVEGLGETADERLLYGAAIVLTLLDAGHGVRTIETPTLIESLEESGLESDRWDDMTLEQEAADIFFNLDMQGPGEPDTTEVRTPAKEEAYVKLAELAPDDR